MGKCSRTLSRTQDFSRQISSLYGPGRTQASAFWSSHCLATSISLSGRSEETSEQGLTGPGAYGPSRSPSPSCTINQVLKIAAGTLLCTSYCPGIGCAQDESHRPSNARSSAKRFRHFEKHRRTNATTHAFVNSMVTAGWGMAPLTLAPFPSSDPRLEHETQGP